MRTHLNVRLYVYCVFLPIISFLPNCPHQRILSECSVEFSGSVLKHSYSLLCFCTRMLILYYYDIISDDHAL